MRTLVLFLCALFLYPDHSVGQLTSNEEWQESLKAYWDQMDAEFASADESPMKENDRASFSHLERFEPKEHFRVMVEFTPTPDRPEFEMLTSTDRKPLYRTAGILRFEMQGERIEMPVYQSIMPTADPQIEKFLFLPFTDLTNGLETYGGGRYLDLEMPSNGWLEVDFNKAYNPYCAYNDRYSCPIPPRENHIPMRIEAGVLAFGDH